MDFMTVFFYALIGFVVLAILLAVVLSLASVWRAKRAVAHAQKVTFTAGLLDLALRSDYRAVRLDAVARLNDPSALAKAALSSADPRTGLAALERVDDAETLGEIARLGEEREVRQAACGRLGHIGDKVCERCGLDLTANARP